MEGSEAFSYADYFTPEKKKTLQLFTEEGTRWAPETERMLWSKEIFPPAKNTRHSFDPIKVHNNYLKTVLERTEKERQCTCKVTFRSVRATTAAMEKQ